MMMLKHHQILLSKIHICRESQLSKSDEAGDAAGDAAGEAVADATADAVADAAAAESLSDGK